MPKTLTTHFIKNMNKPINIASVSEQLKRLKTPTIKGDPLYAATFIPDLLETAQANQNCVGLTLNQIWTEDTQAPNIFVALISGKWRVFINSTSQRSGSYIQSVEGCMSKPGYQATKTRRARITVTYQDATGEVMRDSFVGQNAIIIQHELDHLTGTLI